MQYEKYEKANKNAVIGIDSSENGPASSRLPSRWEWVSLIVILAFIALIRWQLLAFPLERDEGDYAYGAQLLLQGGHIYEDFYSMRLPGIYLVYAVILTVFGQTITGIHFALLLSTLACSILVFFIGRHLFGPIAGLSAGLFYGMLASMVRTLGPTANSEHFINLFLLVGLAVLLLTRAHKAWVLIAAGLAVGMAFIIKQHAALLLLYGLALVWLPNWNQRPIDWKIVSAKTAYYSLGAAAPFFICLGVIWVSGDWNQFVLWAFQYARAYASAVPLDVGLEILSSRLKILLPLTWPFALLTIGGVFTLINLPQVRTKAVIVLGMFASACVMVSIGFYFRMHYFLFLYPSVSLLAGLGLSRVARMASDTKRVYAVGVFVTVFAVGWTLSQEWRMYFHHSPDEASRLTYSINPFPESVQVARYIEERTDPDDRILVMGSESQIPFYAHRRSATSYVYIYSLMEDQPFSKDMQREFIRQAEVSNPMYIVFVSAQPSWLRMPGPDHDLMRWFSGTVKESYRLEAFIPIKSFTMAELVTISDTNPGPHSKQPAILLFRRTMSSVKDITTD